MKETIVVDRDPRPGKVLTHRDTPVTATIEVPEKATSSGWGDMSWLDKR